MAGTGGKRTLKSNDTDPETLLAALSHARGPMTQAELSERLQIGAGQAQFEAALAELEHAGRIVRNRAGLLLVAARANLFSGRVQGHRDGYGFLIRDDGGPDLVLAEHEMSRVLHGDRVLARQAGQDRRGRPMGEIVEVIEHRTNRLVGRLLNERGVTIVVPEDQRISHDILLPPGATAGAEHGQVVVVEIVQQPQRHVQPVGRVIEVLGAIDDPGMEIEIAVRKFAVPHEFPPAALAAAEQLAGHVVDADLQGRVDLRDVPLVTIDGEDARDFDDAVYCEPMNERRTRWRLLVAIADVGHYVASGGALDAEAQNRSTSVYFPRRVIPMLPEKLSNGICSLKPMVDRLVLVADMVISARGAISAYQFYPAVMHSHARLTYNEVWEALSVPDSRAAQRLAPVMAQLGDLHDLYRLLARARGARGALEMDTTETYIVCDAQGRIEKILPRTRNDAHRLIEEMMLAANVCAADLLARHKHPALYRVHEGPTPERLENLRTLLKALGLTLGGGGAPKPKDFAELLEHIRNRPDTQLLQTVLLRTMQQAVYSPHNVGHFGLAYEAYAHFTSPIRRYPDLLGDARGAGRGEGDAATGGADGSRRRGGAVVGEARPAVLGQRAACRRRVARRRGLAEELVHARAGRRDLHRNDQRGGAVRHLRRPRRPLRRGPGARLGAGQRVLPVQRADARAARRTHRPSLPARRPRGGAGGAGRPGGAADRVPAGARTGPSAAGWQRTGQGQGARAQGRQQRAAAGAPGGGPGKPWPRYGQAAQGPRRQQGRRRTRPPRPRARPGMTR